MLTRTLPANIQAEQMLLGAILINPDTLVQVQEFLRGEHFFEKLHQDIYKSILSLTDKNLVPTAITLKSMLDKNQAFVESGGLDYLNKLATLAMMVINAHDYGLVIYDLALKRDLIKIGEEIVNNSYNSSLEQKSADQIEQAESMLYRLAAEGTNERSFVRLQVSIDDSLSSINRAMKTKEHVIGVTTGFNDLDAKLSGFHRSDLVIIAARPSMGKTAFALNLAVNTAKALLDKYDSNKDEQLGCVGILSLEMSAEQLSTRILSMYASLDSSSLRSGRLTELEYNDLRKAAIEISQLPLFIDDTPALSISAIRTRARKLKRKHNLKVLFVDYLQLIRGGSKSENRVHEISEITQGLKAIAKELDISVIALSQLSRAVEQREDKRPMLSDLRDSGSIEQDADIVMFIYREEYYLIRQQPAPGDEKHATWQAKFNEVMHLADIMIAKHRNGPVGNIVLHYDNRYSKFSNNTNSRH